MSFSSALSQQRAQEFSLGDQGLYTGQTISMAENSDEDQNDRGSGVWRARALDQWGHVILEGETPVEADVEEPTIVLRSTPAAEVPSTGEASL